MSVITGLVSFGSSIGDILNTWANLGVFAYALPFLLVFALVFGILFKSKILGDNKGVIVVIALTVGLLSLQYDKVPQFFAKIFPYAGMGMSILLVALIMMGLFAKPDEKWFTITFASIGGLIALIVILSALVENEWWGSGGWWWSQYWPAIVAMLIIVGLIVLVIFATKKQT